MLFFQKKRMLSYKFYKEAKRITLFIIFQKKQNKCYEYKLISKNNTLI
jgi:hypothetical protein